MAQVNVSYDPRWFEFLKSHPAPSPTQEQSAAQGRFDQLFKDIYNPDSPSFHQYLQGGQFDTMFPELVAARNAQAEWERSTADLFKKQYGTNHLIVGDTGNPITPPTSLQTGYVNDEGSQIPFGTSPTNTTPPPITPPLSLPGITPPPSITTPSNIAGQQPNPVTVPEQFQIGDNWKSPLTKNNPLADNWASLY